MSTITIVIFASISSCAFGGGESKAVISKSMNDESQALSKRRKSEGIWVEIRICPSQQSECP